MDKYINAYNSMGNSGFELVDFIFKVCVIALVDLANLFGISKLLIFIGLKSVSMLEVNSVLDYL